MHTLLSFIAFISIAILSLRLMAHTHSPRKSILIITTLWSVLIVLSTEFLSLFGAFTICGLGIFWALAVITVGTTPLEFKPAGLLDRLKVINGLSFPDQCLIASIAVIVLITGITALAAPPNNWDSMTYHMSRVAHWVQNQSVQFYPSSMPRQLWASPWSEYAIAQLQILTQSDRLANMVQWWSMIGSLIGVSLIAKTLGSARRGQILSAVFCATIPVGILQSSSTQNDYAAAFWCVSCVYFGLSWLSQPRLRRAFFGGICLGLAVLSKSTSLLVLPPFLIWLTLSGARHHPRKFPAALAFLIAVPLLINAPQFMRNYNLNGNIFSLRSESKTVTNDTHNAQAVISTALRYLGLNLCTSNASLNNSIAVTITKIHEWLEWNIMDPRFSMGEEYKIKQDIHEDNSCNTALTIVLLIMTALFVIRLRSTGPSQLKIYLLALAAGFLLFCLMLKWQPWGNRLLLPLYVLSTPFLGTFFEKRFPRAGLCVAFALIILCIPWLTHNRSRPLVTKPTIFTKARNEQYFNNIDGEYFSYKRAAEEIEKSGCRQIALVMTSESWEYPLWPLLGAPKAKDLRIEHVNVQNPSKQFAYPLGDFDPCVAVHDTAQGISKIKINNMDFIKTDQWTYLSLYRKDPDGKLAQTVRSANFSQMLRYALESDAVLKQAQALGKLDAAALSQSMQLRRLSVDYAGMLDVEELNTLYGELGNAVRDLFIQGNGLLLEGLTEQNPGKISEGQQRLDQWTDWLSRNMEKLQTILQ